MTLALTLAAVRRHPFSIAFTVLIVVVFASLASVSVPLALGTWLATAVATLEVWYALEPLVLRQFGGYRDPSHAEREALGVAITSSSLELLLGDGPGLAIGRGLRCLVVSRDALELLDERPLGGLLTQATHPIHSASLAGDILVWLGNLALFGAWCIDRGLGQLGRLLGVLVGESLVLPLVVCRDGFLRWSGWIFGSLAVVLLGSTLLSSGFAAAGLALLAAPPLMVALSTVLAWERRRVERAADEATIGAGFGAQLLEAVELLAVAEPRPRPTGVLRMLCPPGAPLTNRAARIRQSVFRPQAEQ
jgi:hypothetical protein